MAPDFDPVLFRKGVSMHTGLKDHYDTLSRQELINLLRQAQCLPEKRVRNSQIDIGFLYASPLVYRDQVGLKALRELNFIKEAQTIKESVRKSGKAVKFKSMVATEEHFDEMLRLEP